MIGGRFRPLRWAGTLSKGMAGLVLDQDIPLAFSHRHTLTHTRANRHRDPVTHTDRNKRLSKKKELQV